MGSGAVLSLTPPHEIYLIYLCTPVVKNFKERLKPFNVVIQNETKRTVPGGIGSIKAIGNYAAILKAQAEAKADGFSDILYLDSVDQRYVEQASTSNIFVVKDKVISTPVHGGNFCQVLRVKVLLKLLATKGFQVFILRSFESIKR